MDGSFSGLYPFDRSSNYIIKSLKVVKPILYTRNEVIKKIVLYKRPMIYFQEVNASSKIRNKQRYTDGLCADKKNRAE